MERKNDYQELIEYLEANHQKWELKRTHYDGGNAYEAKVASQSDLICRCYTGTLKEILEEMKRRDNIIEKVTD